MQRASFLDLYGIVNRKKEAVVLQHILPQLSLNLSKFGFCWYRSGAWHCQRTYSGHWQILAQACSSKIIVFFLFMDSPVSSRFSSKWNTWTKV